ncbi:MAG: hypothetical protein JWN78_663 [Bacteroidota bacterium]|nr:hypothetical protein [Bacteroidota bacterium]
MEFETVLSLNGKSGLCAYYNIQNFTTSTITL